MNLENSYTGTLQENDRLKLDFNKKLKCTELFTAKF